MPKFVFTEKARKQFRKLPEDVRNRIKSKLKDWEIQENPLVFSKSTPHLQETTHRFRIGDYRLLCNTNEKYIQVHTVKHRDHVYL